MQAISPLMDGNTNHTILESFGMESMLPAFESALGAFGFSNAHNITNMIVGCDKDIAIRFADGLKGDYVNVKISSQRISISDIQSILKETVFAIEQKKFGWFIFVDENILASWEHECNYIFFVNEDDIIARDMLTPPRKNVTLEVI